MRRGVIILVLGVFVSTAMSGQLDDLEKKSKKEKSSSSSSAQPQSKSSDSNSSFGSGTYPSSSSGNNFAGDFLVWLVTAPFTSWNNEGDAFSSEDSVDGEGWAEGGSGFFPGHALGSSTMPYVRADFNWQHINSDLEAHDFRIEAGYKLLAFHGRHTLYTESNPADELTFNQYYGVLRYGGALRHGYLSSASWEAGLGLGMVQQIGNEEESSGAFTVPLKFYPTEWFGVEFRPAWYHWNDRTIGDYDLSASLGWNFVQVRGGYRWLWMHGVGHMLNGPYAGVSVSF